MMKNNGFDCVEMQHNAQERLRKEYEARKDEFSSYAEFLNKTAEESEEVRAFLARIRKAKQKAKV